MEGNNVLGRIEEMLPAMSKNQRKLASYVLNHYDRVVFLSAAKLGKELEVSESTVVRFAMALGFSGYPEFQEELEGLVQSRLKGSETEEEACYGRSQSELLTTVLRADAQRVLSSLDSVDAAGFEEAVESIMKAETVYLCGLRSNEVLSSFLNYYLNLIKKKVVLLRASGISETFEQMLYLGDRDCLIGIDFPRYSKRTELVAQFARDRGAKVIALTDKADSPLAEQASVILVAKSSKLSIVDSLVAPLSLINAIIVACTLKQPEVVRENLKTLEDVWKNRVQLKEEIEFLNEGDLILPREEQDEQ